MPVRVPGHLSVRRTMPDIYQEALIHRTLAQVATALGDPDRSAAHSDTAVRLSLAADAGHLDTEPLVR